ncbi:MAG: dimethylsulfonioproprionate lyase family protein [Granulosicoccus sp.]
MHHRSPELTQFLSTLHQAIIANAAVDSEAHRVTDSIMSALREPKATANRTACTLPLCTLLNEVVGELDGESMAVQHAHAMEALAPSLKWWLRPDASQIGEPFASGHANATVIGRGGLEEREDVWVGISLLAPDINYPVHHHPPEEVYLVLSPGEWQQDNGDWHEPGVGGIVYNPPDILHAMRSGSRPLLATWCLLALAD